MNLSENPSVMTRGTISRGTTPIRDEEFDSVPSTNERILKECNQIYTDPKNGLIRIGEQFGLKLSPPRKKIVILLIGNHSAGKSSFINWYIEDNVQKTGVAIETQGFTFVTSGRRRESLTGEATLFLYPHFKPLAKIKGVIDFLSTEISPSKQKKFSLVTFVDTPGLVDGDMQCPFDVNKAIIWLGNVADLIFVFFDPMGQALCKRTLDIAEKLNEKHSDKIKFYLSKADQAGTETDRQRVMMQIVQELCKRPGLNRQGFDMPTIYVPDLSGNVRCVNQMDEVCFDVEKTINATVQNTLNTLTKDCNSIRKLLNEALENNNMNLNYNVYSVFKVILNALLSCLASGAALLILFSFVHGVQKTTFETSSFLYHLVATVGEFNTTTNVWLLVFSVLLAMFFAYAAIKALKWRAILGLTRGGELKEWKLHMEEFVARKRDELYVAYLEQSVGSHDLSA